MMPPEPTDTAEATDEVATLDDEQADLVATWREAKASARKLAAEESDLRERVLAMLRRPDGSLPTEAYANGRLLLRLATVDTDRVDSRALYAAYPDLWRSFVTSRSHVRVTVP